MLDRGGRRRAAIGVLYLFLAKIFQTDDECLDRGGGRRAAIGVLYLFWGPTLVVLFLP